VNPVVAVLLGALLAQETLNGRILAASAVIIGSVVFINSAHLKKEVEGAIENEPVAAD
jgi:drug/metabolite transporter (DMT)-like permease